MHGQCAARALSTVPWVDSRACGTGSGKAAALRFIRGVNGGRVSLSASFRVGNKRNRGWKVTGARAEGDSHKMYVPPDAFGGTTPERKAAKAIRAMHTYVAAHIVAGQLMNIAPRINTLNGSQGGSGADGTQESVRVAQGYDLIMAFLEENPVRDGDEWLKKLAGQAPSIASRIATVRLAYCTQDFEWDTLKRVCAEETQAANVEVMRSWVTAVFGEEQGGGGGGAAGSARGGGGGSVPPPPPPAAGNE